MVDLDAGARLVGTLDDGGGAAAGTLEGDGLLLGTVHLPGARERETKKRQKILRGVRNRRQRWAS